MGYSVLNFLGLTFVFFAAKLMPLEINPSDASMLKSMTAYGRKQVTSSVGRVVVEIQSVNRKFLDLSVNLPRELSCFDPEVRKWTGQQIQRGKVTVSLKFFPLDDGPVRIEANLPLARSIAAAWETLCGSGIASGPLTSEALLRQDGVLTTTVEIEDASAYRELLREAFDGAMADYQEMQKNEGRELEADILARGKLIGEMIEKIAPYTAGACDRFRDKLLERIGDLVEGADADDRILREVALYAEKLDIEEELTRARSHLQQLEKLLKKEKPVGKTLDFLLQELFRETNTIASKSSHVEISELVVTMKAELERIREQVQNVE